jgi:hypothetical protein
MEEAMTDRLRLAAQAFSDAWEMWWDAEAQPWSEESRVARMRTYEMCNDAQAELRRALAEHEEEPNTNEFWADGMRVGKAVGFKNGVAMAARHVACRRWQVGERD